MSNIIHHGEQDQSDNVAHLVSIQAKYVEGHFGMGKALIE